MVHLRHLRLRVRVGNPKQAGGREESRWRKSTTCQLSHQHPLLLCVYSSPTAASTPLLLCSIQCPTELLVAGVVYKHATATGEFLVHWYWCLVHWCQLLVLGALALGTLVLGTLVLNTGAWCTGAWCTGTWYTGACLPLNVGHKWSPSASAAAHFNIPTPPASHQQCQLHKQTRASQRESTQFVVPLLSAASPIQHWIVL